MAFIHSCSQSVSSLGAFGWDKRVSPTLTSSANLAVELFVPVHPTFPFSFSFAVADAKWPTHNSTLHGEIMSPPHLSIAEERSPRNKQRMPTELQLSPKDPEDPKDQTRSSNGEKSGNTVKDNAHCGPRHDPRFPPQ